MRHEFNGVTRRACLTFSAALLASAQVPVVFAQRSGWPRQPVKLVVGFPPGGGVDVVARILADSLAKLLGVPIVIDNRPGAASNLAAGEVARASADGYTVLIAPTSVQSANPFLYRANVDPGTDLLPVAAVSRYQLHMIVRNGYPASDVMALIANAKRQPGVMTYSSAGVGSTPHLISELFLRQADIKAVHVPYRGSAAALQAVLAGEVDFVMDPGISFQHVRTGKVSMFGVASQTRSREFPEIKTLGELGIKGLDYDTWVGLWMPRGVNSDIISQLSRATEKVLAMDEVRQKLLALSCEPSYMPPTEFEALLKKETAAFSELIKSANIVLI